MEALVLLLGEMIAVLFAGAFTVFAEIFLVVFAGIVELVFTILGAGSIGLTTASTDIFLKHKKSRKPDWIKSKAFVIFRNTLFGLLALTLMLAILVNTVLFEPALRKVCSLAENKTDIHVSFLDASGSFFSGEFNLTAPTIKREGHPSSNFDLQADRITIKLPLKELFESPVVLESVEVHGLEGRFMHKRTEEEPLESRRGFEIRSLQLTDCIVEVNDLTTETPFNFMLTLDTLESKPLRSSFAVLDILFRSNARGCISGHPFELSTKRIPNGRKTSWAAEALPMEIPAHYVGGLFSWLKEGSLNISLTDEWTHGEQTVIDTHCSIDLNNVVAEVPEDLGRFSKALAAPSVEFINAHGEHLPLSFSFTMNEEEFRGATSLEAAGLWNVFSSALVDELSAKLALEKESLKDTATKGMNFVKGFLDKKRKASD